MDFISRWFKYGSDYKGQRHLFALSFPEAQGSAVLTDEHYNWKFQQFPSNPPSYEFVASDQDEIVGYYAAVPYQYKINNQSYTCGMVCDVMTHPKMRGKGVFTKLGAFSTQELEKVQIDFVSGYPIRPEVIPGHLKVGWFVGFKLPMFIRILKINNLVKHSFLRPFYGVINFLIGITQSLTLFLPKSGVVTIQTRDQFLSDPDYSDFFEKWAQTQSNYLIKSKEFLQWRTNAPSTEYLFFKLVDQGQTLGWAIGRNTQLQGVSVLAILDMMVLPLRFSFYNQLHASFYEYARGSGLDAIVAMMSSDWARKYKLFPNLWIPSPAIFSIIFKVLNKNMDKSLFKQRTKWHLMWIDSDDL